MNKDYDHIREYLDKLMSNDYYKDEERLELRMLISDFAILWNRYENHFVPQEDNKKLILEAEVMNKMKEIKSFQLEKDINYLYSQLLNYFSNRKIAYNVGAIKKHFHIDSKFDRYASRTLEKVIKCDTFDKRLEFMLIILKRVRNNMFHGTKHIIELHKNKDLFIWCNKFLWLILDYNHVSIVGG